MPTHTPLIPDSTKTERLIALVDPDMKARLVLAADMAEISLGEYVRRAIEAALPDADTLRYHREAQRLHRERSAALEPRSFARFLAGRIDEGSPVGDLARDVARDIKDGGFAGEFTPRELRERMEELNAIEAAMDAFDTALLEYRRQA